MGLQCSTSQYLQQGRLAGGTADETGLQCCMSLMAYAAIMGCGRRVTRVRSGRGIVSAAHHNSLSFLSSIALSCIQVPTTTESTSSPCVYVVHSQAPA